MTVKSDFNAEEWATVVEGPAIAGLAVVAAERGGTLRESLALGRAYASVLREGATELVQEVVNSAPAIQPPRLNARDDLPDHAVERVREAAAIVGRHAGADELDDYRTLVLEAARAVAEAHKEGGVLGIGGRPVSDKEQAVLDRIGEALGSGTGTS
jgi:hypothetical protein